MQVPDACKVFVVNLEPCTPDKDGHLLRYHFKRPGGTDSKQGGCSEGE